MKTVDARSRTVKPLYHSSSPNLTTVLHCTVPQNAMLSRFIKRQTKTNGPQCPERSHQRKIVFCDWGWHGRSSNDGWCFTYVDEAEFDAEEDLRCYKRTTPADCGETLSKFVRSQLRKNSNLKGSKGWCVPNTAVVDRSLLTLNQAVYLSNRRWDTTYSTSPQTR